MPRSRPPRRPDDPRQEDPEVLRGRESYEKGKSFEEKVAELFVLQGYRALVGYKRNDMQFDIRLELAAGAFHVLVECKNTDRSVTQLDVSKLAAKVFSARNADKLHYQAIVVSCNGFAENAHATATGWMCPTSRWTRPTCRSTCPTRRSTWLTRRWMSLTRRWMRPMSRWMASVSTYSTLSTTFPTARPCSTNSCASAIRSSGRRTAMLWVRRPASRKAVRSATARARSSELR